MPKITITIEDLPNGQVKVVAEPNVLEMMKVDQSGYGLSPAHGYALSALNRIRQVNQKSKPSPIILPHQH